MILVFLIIYIIHAILLVLLIQFLFTGALTALSNLVLSATECFLSFLEYIYSWLVGEHLVLQHFILFPKDYLQWYLTPITIMKESSIGKLLLKIENAYVIGILSILICFVVDNIRSYKKLCELARNLETFDEQCPICLEDLITPNEEAERIKCGHYFHNSCLSKWIMDPNDRPNEPKGCPVCRQPLF